MALASPSERSPSRAARPDLQQRVSVARLTLTGFRCYDRQRLETGPEPVVLTGPNGAGKTTLLEAVSLLSPGRGLRRARLDEIGRRTGDQPAADWAVAAQIRTATGAVDIGTGRSAAAAAQARDRRQVRIDGHPAKSQSALAAIVGVTWVTPEMDRLFVDGTAARRRFLDRLVFGIDPAHAGRVGAYERALQQRARLLRRGQADPAWLTALEEIMAADGVAVAAARRDLVVRLSRASTEGGGPFPGAMLATSGAVESWLDEAPALVAEDRLREALADSRRLDAEAGGAAVGPHKSDLKVSHAASGRSAAACSTGEQKVLLIAIVLAAARLQATERASTPVLLLDEVAAHLDARHRAALFEAVAALDAQAWYAGTDVGLFEPLAGRAQFFAVEGGSATRRRGDG
ncbi:MAG: DNA replication/repair protein RecF [Rhodospirillales bacterium]